MHTHAHMHAYIHALMCMKTQSSFLTKCRNCALKSGWKCICKKFFITLKVHWSICMRVLFNTCCYTIFAKYIQVIKRTRRTVKTSCHEIKRTLHFHFTSQLHLDKSLHFLFFPSVERITRWPVGIHSIILGDFP